MEIREIDSIYFSDHLLHDDLKAKCIFNKMTVEDIRSICDVMNNLKTGVGMTTFINDHSFKRLTFMGCQADTVDGSIKLDNHKTHHGLKEPFTIYLTPSCSNKIEVKNGLIRWTCVKDEDRPFPKSGKEFLKRKFYNLDVDCVRSLLSVHDIFIETYNETIRNGL